MGILKGKMIDSLAKPFSSDTHYKGFFEKLDALLPRYLSVEVTASCSHGVVTGAGSYMKSSKVTLTCTPADGWNFKQWNKNGSFFSTSAQIEDTVTVNTSYVAEVVASKTYEITTACVCGTVSGAGYVTSGGSCTLTCTPSSGFSFKEWSDGVTTNPRSVTNITADAFYKAICIPTGSDQDYFTVSAKVSPEDAGMIQFGDSVRDFNTYLLGEECDDLTAVSYGQSYYQFVEWSDGDTNNPHTAFTVTRDVMLEARFTDNRHYCSVIEWPTTSQRHYRVEGDINVSLEMYEEQRTGFATKYWFRDTDAYVHFIPDENYIITGIKYRVWYEGGGSETAQTISGVDSWNYGIIGFGNQGSTHFPIRIQIYATTANVNYHINFRAVPSGIASHATLSFDLDGRTIQSGASWAPNSGTDGIVRGSAEIDEGYEFDHWKVNGIPVSGGSSGLEFDMHDYMSDVTAECVLVATYYTLTYSSDAGGAVVATDAYGNYVSDGDEFLLGTPITFNCVFQPHYRFSHWTDNNLGEDHYTQTYTISTTTNGIDVTLHTEVDPNHSDVLTSVTPSGSATISVSPDPSASYWEGDTLDLSASCQSGYVPLKWERYDGTQWIQFAGAVSSVHFVCPAYSSSYPHYDIRLTTQLIPCTFDINAQQGITVAASVGGTAVQLPYNGHYGDVVSVSLSYSSVAYSGVLWNDGSTLTSRQFTLYSSSTPSVTLVGRDLYSINVVSTGNGDVSGDGNYYSNSSCTVTATPYTDYQFVHWLEGGNVVYDGSSPAGATYTFTVTSARVLEAVFARVSVITISTVVSPSGAGSVQGDGAKGAGEVVSLKAIPAEGYEFTEWREGSPAVQVSTDNPYVFNASVNRNLTAVFTAQTYTLTLNYDNTTIDHVVGAGSYPAGTNVSFSAVPKSHYHFTFWSDGNSSNPRSLQLNSNTTLSASGAININQLTVTPTGCSVTSVTVGGSPASLPSPVPYNSAVVVTVSPSFGKLLNRASWNNVPSGTTFNADFTVATFNMPDNAVPISVVASDIEAFSVLRSYNYVQQVPTPGSYTEGDGTEAVWPTARTFVVPCGYSSIAIWVESTLANDRIEVTLSDYTHFTCTARYINSSGSSACYELYGGYSMYQNIPNSTITFSNSLGSRTYTIRAEGHHLMGYVIDPDWPSAYDQYHVRGAMVRPISSSGESQTFQWYFNPQTIQQGGNYNWNVNPPIAFGSDNKTVQNRSDKTGNLITAMSTESYEFVDSYDGTDLCGVVFNTDTAFTVTDISHPEDCPYFYQATVNAPVNNSGHYRYFLLITQTTSGSCPVLFYQSPN